MCLCACLCVCVWGVPSVNLLDRKMSLNIDTYYQLAFQNRVLGEKNKLIAYIPVMCQFLCDEFLCLLPHKAL